jgi:type II secretory pathway component PulF
MAGKVTNFISVLAVIVVFCVFLCSETLAAPAKFDPTPTTIIAFATNAGEIDFTPQVRQQLQAVRQRRNKEIEKVLKSSQIAELTQNLRSGDNFYQALEKLKLQGEQKELVEAIAKISDLKIKGIISRYSLQTPQK